MQAARGTAVAGGDVPAHATTRPATRWVWLTALVVLAADVTSKAIVVSQLSDRPPVHLLGHVLELTLLRNGGAAFSVGAGSTILFTAVAVAVVVVIARTARQLMSRRWAMCLGLLLGGQLAPTPVRLAAVGQAAGSVSVPPLEDGPGVDIGQADEWAGPLATEGLVAEEEPDEVPAGLLLGVRATAVATADLAGRQVGNHG